MDLGSIQFNPNHKIEASARDASEGMRFLIIGFGASAISVLVSLFGMAGVFPSGLVTGVLIALWFVSLAGVYGAYLAANAFGGPGVGLVAIVVGAIIPFVKFVIFIVLLAMSIDLIRRAGFSVSFFGPLKKRA